MIWGWHVGPEYRECFKRYPGALATFGWTYFVTVTDPRIADLPPSFAELPWIVKGNGVYESKSCLSTKKWCVASELSR